MTQSVPLRPLVLVVPCFNERRRLRGDDFLGAIDRDPSLGLLFVDDGSRDGTGEQLVELARSRPAAIGALRLETNSGKAEAVRRGVLAALDSGCELTGYWDADLATPFEALGSMREILETRSSVEAVLGSRVALLGRDIRRSALRHYLGRVFATLASTILDVVVYDTQCGAKVLRSTPAMRGVFARPFLSRWLFDVEVLARLKVDGNSSLPLEERVAEFPLERWEDVKGSKIGGREMVRAAGELVRLARHYARPCRRARHR